MFTRAILLHKNSTVVAAAHNTSMLNLYTCKVGPQSIPGFVNREVIIINNYAIASDLQL